MAEQQRALGEQQADRVLDRVDAADEVVLVDEVEQVHDVVTGGPRREREERRADVDAVARAAAAMARAASAAVWPLSSRSSMSSLTDSNADTTKTHPDAAISAHRLGVAQDVFHLDRAVEGEHGWRSCRARTMRSECGGALRKSGSAKVMWRAPAADELIDVVEHGCFVDAADPAVEHDGNRAVPAPVRAALGGDDGADEPRLAVDHEPRVAIERREQRPVRRRRSRWRRPTRRAWRSRGTGRRKARSTAPARRRREPDHGRVGRRCAWAPRTRPRRPTATSSGSQASTDTSIARTSCPTARAVAVATANASGCWPSS